LFTGFQDIRNFTSDFRGFKDFRYSRDFKDSKSALGLRPDFKDFWSGFRDFGDFKSVYAYGFQDRLTGFQVGFQGF